MAHVFISYSSKDSKVAATVCEALERRGLKCWISSRDIEPGQNFQQAIVRAIRSARVMVLVFTTNANNSNEIMKEVALAGQYGLVVIPVRVEDVLPNDAFAYEFATRQWIDLFQDWERSIERLAQQISIQTAEPKEGTEAATPELKPPPAPPPPPPPAVQVAAKQPKPGRHAWIWASLATVLILLVWAALVRKANVGNQYQRAQTEQPPPPVVQPPPAAEERPVRQAEPAPPPPPPPPPPAPKPIAVPSPEPAPKPEVAQKPPPSPPPPPPPPPQVATKPPPSLTNVVWQGTYVCNGVIAGGTLTILQQAGGSLEARFNFYPLNQYSPVKAGSYMLEGTVDMAAHRVILTPTRWIYQPFNYVAGGFDGYYDPQNGNLSGKVLLPNCGMYIARPMSSSN